MTKQHDIQWCTSGIYILGVINSCLKFLQDYSIQNNSSLVLQTLSWTLEENYYYYQLFP